MDPDASNSEPCDRIAQLPNAERSAGIGTVGYNQFSREL
jgi:hypothetical protein